jgi:hypothetical protein
MRMGVSLPSTDIGGDPIVQKDFAQAVEGMGFDHLAVYDHVVGINPGSPPPIGTALIPPATVSTILSRCSAFSRRILPKLS